jgi:hypothetical protein
MDLIDRHRKWKVTHGHETDSDSGENSDGGDVDNPDADWDIGTIKEPISPYIEDNGIDPAGVDLVQQQNGDLQLQQAAAVAAARARSPVKSAIDRNNQRHSPSKEMPPSSSIGLKDNRAVAKSEVNIVSCSY